MTNRLWSTDDFRTAIARLLARGGLRKPCSMWRSGKSAPKTQFSRHDRLCRLWRLAASLPLHLVAASGGSPKLPNRHGPISGDRYLISLQRSGISQTQQCGRTCELQAGDSRHQSMARARSSVTFPQTVDQVVAVIFSAMLNSGLFARPGCGAADRPHGPRQCAARRAADLYRAAGWPRVRLPPAEAELLADNLCNLVALLSARGAEEHAVSQHRISDLDCMFAFLRRHLEADPDLSPQALADR